MEDKKLIQLLSKLNKSYQNCKQGTADDIRLTRAAKHYYARAQKNGKVEQQYLN